MNKKIIILLFIYLIPSISIAGFNGDIGYTGNAYSRQVKTSGFEKLLQKQYQSNSMKNARYWSQASASVGSLGAGMKALAKVPIQQGVDLFASALGMITKPTLANAAILAKRAVPIATYVYIADWLLSAGLNYHDGQYYEINTPDYPNRVYTGALNFTTCTTANDQCSFDQVLSDLESYKTTVQYPGTTMTFYNESASNSCFNPAASSPCLVNYKIWYQGNSTNYGQQFNYYPYAPGHPSSEEPIADSEAAQRLAEQQRTPSEYDGILDELDKTDQLPEPDNIEVSGPSEVNHPGYPKTETYPDKVVETDKKNTITYQGDTITISPTITTQTTIFNDNSTELITTEEALPEPESEEEEKEDKDPCEDFPERVSCWEAGETPQVGPIPETEQEVTYTPVSVGTSGSCPSDISINLSFATVNFPLSHICNFATAVKPFFIIMASLTALGIVFSSVRD